MSLDNSREAPGEAAAEAAILRSCQAGDWSSYGLLVERYQRLVWAAVDSVTPEKGAVPELVHDCFVRAYQKLHLYQFRSGFASWLYRLSRNHALSAVRAAGRRPVQLLAPRELEAAASSSPGAAAGQEQDYIEQQRSRALRRMLAELPPQYHEVLALHYFHGLSYELIAAALDLPLNTVRTHLRRARLRLIELAGKSGWIEGAKHE